MEDCSVYDKKEIVIHKSKKREETGILIPNRSVKFARDHKYVSCKNIFHLTRALLFAPLLL